MILILPLEFLEQIQDEQVILRLLSILQEGSGSIL